MNFRTFVLNFLFLGASVSAAPQAEVHGPGLQQRDGVSFNCHIPYPPGKLPVFVLGAAARFPETLFQNTLNLVAGGDITKQEEDGGVYYYNNGRLLGYYETDTGESYILPNLAALTPGQFQLDPSILHRLVTNKAIIPADDTGKSIIPGLILSGSKNDNGSAPTAPATYLIEGTIRRDIPFQRRPIPVHGDGSQATFSFASDGKLVSLVHRWRAASQGRFVQSLNQDGIRKAIAQHLEASGLANAIVTGVELGYYDTSEKFIQPVWVYNATIQSPENVVPKTVTGYVPLSGEEQEPLPPIVTPDDGPEPGPHVDGHGPGHGKENCDNTTISYNSTLSRRQAQNSVTLGRYIMANDYLSEAMVKEANALWKGLSGSAPRGRVIDSQYYWDNPTTYQSPTSDLWLNAVNIGFSSGHGKAHNFITDNNWPARGEIEIPSSLPAAGYGPASGGQLAYWMLAQCSVIPTPKDYPPRYSHMAFDPWWQVFDGGMHAIMGFRTDSKISGKVMQAMGKNLGRGASAPMSWLHGVKKLARTSVIFPCGHDNDNIYEVGNLGQPGCLHMFWYN